MRVIHSWDTGDITTDTFGDFLEFFLKLDCKLETITLRPLTAEALMEISIEIIPKQVKSIKLINLMDQERSSKNESVYILQDDDCRRFVQSMRGLNVQVIQGVRWRPFPAERIVYQVPIPKTHYSLDSLEEKAKSQLSDYVSIEQGFTLDSPLNDDREFGVYDSLEVKLSSPFSQRIYTFVIDRFGYKLLVTTSASEPDPPSDLPWVSSMSVELRQKLKV